MPSPFPGMDPYFEDPAFWEEFHHVFIAECMFHLTAKLGDGYIAKSEQRVELVSYDDEETARQYVPDVVIARHRAHRDRVAETERGGGVAVAAPVTLQSIDSIEVRETYIEIQRLPDYKVITVIELLSPWNKFGEGIGEYGQKRRSMVKGRVHVVELDLLRRGERTRLVSPLPPGDYYAMIFDTYRAPDVDVYAWTMRHPLPTIPVPLKPGDAPVQLDLAAVVNSVYDRGRYDRKLRYQLPLPEPATDQAQADWAIETLKSIRR